MSADGTIEDHHPRSRLAALVMAERDRWPLWIPVGIGLGIALYFLLPTEPPIWAGALGLAGALAVVVIGRRHAGLIVAGIALAAPVAGFSAAQWRTAAVQAPILAEETRAQRIMGRVVAVEDAGSGRRLILSPVAVPGVDTAATPDRVRIRTPRGDWTPWPGDWVEALAVLSPPPPPVAPGAFDFQRHAFFKGLGAIGFSMGQVRPAAAPVDAPGEGFAIRLSHFRRHVHQRIIAAVPGAEGAVAAALITGERGAIPDDVLVAMRDAGLAHLLAISGLHIGLVAGFIFFCVRAGLALVPAIALRHPIKKWAAAVALVGALGYLLLSGATIPTQRAFLMIGLVLVAVMTDRTGVSMRHVAWAAIAVLLLMPDSLFGASFQLSFAAVIALVAVYEALRDRFTPFGRAWLWWQRLALYVAGVALTTFVAGTATAPYAVFDFNRLTTYGLAANMIAVPITAFWIMPWGLLALCLMPLGLEQLALAPMGWGIGVVIGAARTVSAWPGALHILATPPLWSILLVTFGGLWLCLWQRRWRLAGAPVIAAGLFGFALAAPPVLLITHDARLAGIRDNDGRWLLSSTRREAFVRESWLRNVGATEAGPWPEEGPSAGGALQCDGLGCLYRHQDWLIALVRDPRAAAEDCAAADAVVSFVPLDGTCRPRSGVVVDRFDLWRNGAHALWVDGNRIRVRSSRATRGDRPWVGVP